MVIKRAAEIRITKRNKLYRTRGSHNAHAMDVRALLADAECASANLRPSQKIIRHRPGANCALELLSGGQLIKGHRCSQQPGIKIFDRLLPHSIGYLYSKKVDKWWQLIF